MQYHLTQHRSHDAGGARANRVSHVRKVFFHDAALIITDLGDKTWREPHPVIWKYAECGSLLDQSNFCGAQRHRQIGRDIRADSEAVGVIDYGLNSHRIGKLQRGNVARLCQGPAQGDLSLKFFVVVMGRIRSRCGLKSKRLINDSVIRRGTLVDSRSVYVWFE